MMGRFKVALLATKGSRRPDDGASLALLVFICLEYKVSGLYNPILECLAEKILKVL